MSGPKVAIHVRLPARWIERIDKLAEAEDRSRSEWVRELVRRALDKAK